MSDTERDEVMNPKHTVTLCGKEYEVKSLSLRDQVEIEKRLKMPWNEINFGSASARLEVVYIMLKKSDGSISREGVSDLFDANNGDDLNRMMFIAVLQGDVAELEARQLKNLTRDRVETLEQEMGR